MKRSNRTASTPLRDLKRGLPLQVSTPQAGRFEVRCKSASGGPPYGYAVFRGGARMTPYRIMSDDEAQAWIDSLREA